MSSSVTHFEIYAEDPAKLAEFYRTLLGWQLDKAPGIDYWRIDTGSGESKGDRRRAAAAADPGPAQLGALRPRRVARSDPRADRGAGGAVVRPKAAVPKTAWYAVVADPEGNIFAIWQADPLAMPLPEPDELG